MKNINLVLKTVALAVCVSIFASCNDEAFLEEKSYKNDSAGFFMSEQAMEIGLASAYSEVQYLVFGNFRQPHSWMLFGL